MATVHLQILLGLLRPFETEFDLIVAPSQDASNPRGWQCLTPNRLPPLGLLPASPMRRIPANTQTSCLVQKSPERLLKQRPPSPWFTLCDTTLRTRTCLHTLAPSIAAIRLSHDGPWAVEVILFQLLVHQRPYGSTSIPPPRDFCFPAARPTRMSTLLTRFVSPPKPARSSPSASAFFTKCFDADVWERFIVGSLCGRVYRLRFFRSLAIQNRPSR
ncbi:hypothetical protein MKEN_01331000 [Mycena kentingensis (nom. inval.)]|nr:hypothetical protein MKEN_01331000 [Mycena kentingensis (nom. inval.)]